MSAAVVRGKDARLSGGCAPVVTIVVMTLAVLLTVLPLEAVAATRQPYKLQGMCFSPYLRVSPGAAVSDRQIASLLYRIKPYTYGIRTFCSTGPWAKIVTKAKSMGLVVAAGCDLWKDPAYNEEEVEGLVALARAGKVDVAVVGDETLLGGVLTEDQLIGYIRRVKATGVPTTTSDSYDELLAHPRVMAECDVVIMNSYPFWEGVSINRAVSHLSSGYYRVKRAAGGKRVIVETGWPSAGQKVGSAAPGNANAARYLYEFDRWARSRGVRYYYFEAYDELWKVRNEGEVGAHWGIWDSNKRLKPGMYSVLNR